MRFLRKTKVTKTILVISDIHLGAGVVVEGKRNPLEDFHHDKEMVGFIEYYFSGEYLNRDVELIINGDLFDFWRFLMSNILMTNIGVKRHLSKN